MNHFKLIVPVLILLLAITVPPIVVTSVVAGSAGFLTIRNFASEIVIRDAVNNAQVVLPALSKVNEVEHHKTIVQLSKGYVQFEWIDGKVASRFFKMSEGVVG